MLGVHHQYMCTGRVHLYKLISTLWVHPNWVRARDCAETLVNDIVEMHLYQLFISVAVTACKHNQGLTPPILLI